MTNQRLTAKDIKRARQRVRESQRKFCRRFGVDQSTLSLWERDGPPVRGAARALLDMVIPQLLAADGAREAR